MLKWNGNVVHSKSDQSKHGYCVIDVNKKMMVFFVVV